MTEDEALVEVKKMYPKEKWSFVYCVPSVLDAGIQYTSGYVVCGQTHLGLVDDEGVLLFKFLKKKGFLK